MKAGRRVLAAVAALAVTFSFAACSPKESDIIELPDATLPVGSASDAGEEPLNECNYFEESLYLDHIFSSKAYDANSLVAAVVPHYAPLMGMAASALAAAALQQFELVVVIGPDHEAKGGGISVSGRGWDTPGQRLEGSKAAATAILHNKNINAAENHQLLAEDHSVATLMPYVGYYLPEATVVSMLISKGTEASRLLALADTICQLAREKNVFVLLSVDFSHYQTLEDANAYDQQTMELIDLGETTEILKLGNQNTDSPECLALMLYLGDLTGSLPRQVAHETQVYTENGASYAGSYMSYVLEKQEIIS